MGKHFPLFAIDFADLAVWVWKRSHVSVDAWNIAQQSASAREFGQLVLVSGVGAQEVNLLHLYPFPHYRASVDGRRRTSIVKIGT